MTEISIQSFNKDHTKSTIGSTELQRDIVNKLFKTVRNKIDVPQDS